MPDVIEIRNATVYRGRTKVFENLHLCIREGEHTALLGPNGSGKSTFLKLLTRDIYPIHQPDSRVRLYGQERWHITDLRQRIGIVSHDLQVTYRPTVRCIDVVLSGYYGSIGLWPHQHYTDAQVQGAMEWLDTLEMAGFVQRSFSTLSTGEQRRVLLARALVNDPATLVLDEPTSGLDLKACYQYIDIIRSLIEQGKTILLVTHHIHEIPPEVSRIVLLDRGAVRADGPKERVMNDRTLSALYDTPLQVVKSSNGYYQVLPA